MTSPGTLFDDTSEAVTVDISGDLTRDAAEHLPRSEVEERPKVMPNLDSKSPEQKDKARYRPRLKHHPPIGKTQRVSTHPFLSVVKKILPALFAVFLCSIFLVIPKISNLSGSAEHAFLILVIYTLFFHCNAYTVGKHLQVTAIGIVGAVVGLGWSALATELGCITNRREQSDSSVGGRAVPAIFLTAIAFVGGTLKSRFQALTSGCLLAIFTSIWSLASSVRTLQISATSFLGLLYSALFAAGLSLFSTLLIFPTAANKELAYKLTDALGTASELLLQSMHLFQAQQGTVSLAEVRLFKQNVITLRERLSRQVRQLRPAYEEASFELIFAYFPIQRFETFINTTLKLQTLLCSRMGLDVEANFVDSYELRDSHLPTRLRALVDELAELDLHTLDKIRHSLATASSLRTPIISLLSASSLQSLGDLKRGLDKTNDLLRSAIVEAMDEALLLSDEDRLQGRLFRTNAFRDCFFLTSLLEFSHDVSKALVLSAELPGPSYGTRKRLLFPKLSMAFLNSTSEDSDTKLDPDEVAAEEEEHDEDRFHRLANVAIASKPERAPSIQLQRPRRRLRHRLLSPAYYAAFINEAMEKVNDWLASPAMYRRRVVLSDWHSKIKHSRHLKHGLKCAVGICLLTLPGHLPPSSEGSKWFDGARGPWIAISYLYCLQTTTAATYRVAVFRTLGTLLGAVYGMVAQFIAKKNAYALVALMTVQAPFTNYLIIIKTRFQGIGVVAQLTVPPILFVPYLGLDYSTVVKLAFIRAYDIEIGILAALLASNLFWPYHARVQLVVTCAKITDQLSKLYLSMSKQNLRKVTTYNQETSAQYDNLESYIRVLLSRASNLTALVHLETSLLPKPIRLYESLVSTLQGLLNLLAGLRSIRQHIPRKLTVIDVMHQRTELVSSFLITLHAISHSLHNRTSVPQFLPSPRVALDNLLSAIEEHIATAADLPATPPPEASPSQPLKMPNDTSHSAIGALVVSSMPRLLQPSLPFPPANTQHHQRHPSISRIRPLNLNLIQGYPDTTSPPTSPRKNIPKLGFSFAFALAENEAINEAVDRLEDLLDICRKLYGVATFIQPDEVGLNNGVELTAMSGFLMTHGRNTRTGSPARSRRHSRPGTPRHREKD